jgi:hypothetical protein
LQIDKKNFSITEVFFVNLSVITYVKMMFVNLNLQHQ